VDPKAVAVVTRAVVGAAGGLPVWVKLTPNVADPVPLARAALASGAQAVSLINTLLGMAIDARARRPRLANLYGGLSGPAIKPVGLRMVHQVARALPGAAIVGLGGIISGEDAAEYMLAGARAVQVGTASFVDPGACARIAGELRDFCLEQGIAEVGEFTGGLKI
jgi:dihydroorotate dehydrogenase (NAD+) catalytic subunit